MQQSKLQVEIRIATGKGASRKLRSAGCIPGVVYGRGMEPIAVSVTPKALEAAIAGEGGINNLITLECSGDLNSAVVIVADLQRDALKRLPEHVDFHRVNMHEKVRISVPVTLLGTAAGVKEGGLLDFAHHTLHIECLPTAIPEHIEVDIANLTIGHSIHVSDITFPAGVKCLDHADVPVVGVLGKAKDTAEATEEA
ncbi:MAG: 50S ribosomal protein L25/general stress protein Ctc [Trichlorobacter sp.]|jgi:large subunit ribosomal protein L25